MSTKLQRPIDFAKQEKIAKAVNESKVKSLLQEKRSTPERVQERFSRQYHQPLKMEAVRRGVTIIELLDEFIRQGLGIK